MKDDADKIADAIRGAVRDSSLSRYAIARRSGIDDGHLSRFMAGATGLSLKNLTTLATLLGREIVVRERRRGEKRDE